MAILSLADQIITESTSGVVGRRIGGPNSGATQITAGLNTLAPAAIITYHSHPDAEIMHYVIEGDVEMTGETFENEGTVGGSISGVYGN